MEEHMEFRVCEHCGQVRRSGPGSCPSCTPGSSKLARAAGAALLGLALTGCDGGSADKDVVALYGVPVTDYDSDGYPEGEDCDDTDPDIHPDAPETPGDGVDSNCNDDDDT